MNLKLRGAFSFGTHLARECCVRLKLRFLNFQYRHEAKIAARRYELKCCTSQERSVVSLGMKL